MRQHQEGEILHIRMDRVFPVLTALTGTAIAAGVAYGVFGSDIRQNTANIERHERLILDMGEIKSNQAAATSERAAMLRSLERIFTILDKQKPEKTERT